MPVAGHFLRWYPDEYFRKLRFRKEPPSQLYVNTLANKLDVSGEPYFQYYGQVNLFPGKFKEPSPTLIAPLLRDIAKIVVPELVNDDMSLKNKYMLTSKYPLAEYNSISKFAIDQKPIIDDAWSKATDMLHQCFQPIGDCRITGVMDSMVMCEKQTSPGYPWMLKHPTKSTLFEDSSFVSYYYNFESGIEQQYHLPALIRCFIKKELKKITDVYLHLPRTILAFPAELSILGNRLFGHMNGRIASLGAAGLLPVYVGCTRYFGTWNQIAERLMRFPNINDGDCTKFDRSVLRQMFRTVREFRKAFIKHMHNSIDFFYTTVMYTIIVGIMGDLFAKQSGQTSGQTNTLTDNCLVHLLLWFYHWVTVVVVNVPEVHADWFSFKEHVELIVMGDDVIYSYSDLVKPFMTPDCI